VEEHVSHNIQKWFNSSSVAVSISLSDSYTYHNWGFLSRGEPPELIGDDISVTTADSSIFSGVTKADDSAYAVNNLVASL
jgi:hypothetical protein